MNTNFLFLALSSIALCFTHCPLMCGALAASVPNAAAYHLARAAGYCALGAASWALGHVAAPSLRAHALLLFTAGSLLILLACALAFRGKLLAFFENRRLAAAITAALLSALRRRSLGASALAGALNSLLPCGVVYSFLASAMMAPNLAYAVGICAVFAASSAASLLLLRRILRAAFWRYLAPALLAAQGGYLALKGVMLYE